MKKAAEVFIIIGMILGFPMIIPLIVGGIALNKLDEAEDSSDITGIAILTIFFCSRIAGILMFFLDDDDFCDEDENEEEEEAS